MSECCPCDDLPVGCQPDIPAGLSALPRQPAGFAEYRLDMLGDIPRYAALSRWRAREGDDTGIMLLEMWAYVLDVVGFYDERISNESYLRTAVRRASLRKLVGLIGYLPRPALGASVILAAIADGNQPVTLPPRTGFRSDAFDTEAPQIFETEIEQVIAPLRNEWPLAPVRELLPGPSLMFIAGQAQIDAEQMLAVRWQKSGQPFVWAGRVTSVTTIDALDGDTYFEVTLDPALTLDPSVPLADFEFLLPTASASLHVAPTSSSTLGFTAIPIAFEVNPGLASANATLQSASIIAGTEFGLSATPESGLNDFESIPGSSVANATTTLLLDTVYPEFGVEQEVIVQRGASLHAARVTAVARDDVAVSGLEDSPLLPVTAITLSPALPAGWSNVPAQLIVHFRMTAVGTPTRIAKIHLTVADFAAPGIAIDGIVEPLTEGDGTGGELLLLDALDNGAHVSGGADIDATGAGLVYATQDTTPFSPSLRTPVTAYGNLVLANRGESVFNEVLGSGDAALALQSFTLTNSPLTYFNDLALPDGRRSTLEARVNGLVWQEVASFFGCGPEDQVYIVRHNDDNETDVTFGDGVRGARLPTGVENVTATYRFGGGAAKPPPGGIGQLARPVAGLRRAFNPVAASGGADADQPEDIRRNAPVTALLLGRAVSTQDFAALAREFGGVVNAHVEWAWDERCQGAVVKVWFISDGGDISDDLRAFLIGQADPTTPLAAVEAVAVPTNLTIELEVEPRFSHELIGQAAHAALTDPLEGLLALVNVPIGQALFRSRIFAVLLSIDGVQSVRTLTLDGQPAPAAITTDEGAYRDYVDGLVIHTVDATNVLTEASHA